VPPVNDHFPMANKFWIVTISQDNLESAIEHGLIGLPTKRKYYIESMTESDTIVFYISKKRSGYYDRNGIVSDFGPIAKITGPAFHSNELIWKSRFREIYPWRRTISLVLNKRISARNIISRLTFIHNKRRWGLYFIQGAREITPEDYQTLFDSIARQGR